jgi:hypothetical protein
MGLLDGILDSDQGRLALGLLAASGPRFDGAGFGQRLAEGVGFMDQYRQQKAQKEQIKQLGELRGMQIKMQQQQYEQAKKDQEIRQRELDKSDRLDKLLPQFYRPGSAAEPAVAPTKGFTSVDAMLPPEFRVGTPGVPAKPAVAPSFDMAGFAQAAMGVDPIKGLSFFQALQKDDKPIAVAQGTTLLDPRTRQPIYTAPKEPAQPSAKIQEFMFAKANGYKGSLEDYVAIGPTIMANSQAPLRAAQASNIIEENRYNLPPPQPPTGGVSVTVNGKVINFPNQAAANKFKFAAGIK